MPEAVRAKLPNPVLPAILIGRLAVAREQQGSGLGKQLLIDALIRCLALAESLGVAFEDEPLHLFLPTKTIAVLFGS